MPTALITGAGGLIGAEAVRFFDGKGFVTVGIDNDLRRLFFGDDGSIRGNVDKLRAEVPHFTNHAVDIRDRGSLNSLFREHAFDVILHAAAQPSHDWSITEPLTDFEINAQGTLNLLEAFRQHSPEAVFLFLSTNKVYGDNPNLLPLLELETRWEIAPGHRYENGIDETMSTDQCRHSIFGASKLAADSLVQEYGRYFGLKTGTFRAGCVTGPAQRGVELHGFLNYLVRCVATGRPYRIYGYKGKQVRDNIHAYDLVSAAYEFYCQPRPGEVYNIGGGRQSNCSVLEAIRLAERITGNKASIEYVEQNRTGDHIWYISDISKFQAHYPEWRYRYDLEAITSEIAGAVRSQVSTNA